MQQIKPVFILNIMEQRLEYAKQAIEKLDTRAIFIFSNKEYYNFEGTL